MEEDDIVRYRFAGKELKLQFVAPVTYMMTDALVVKPAGTVPRAWRDGVAMGFQRWDSYRVLSGHKDCGTEMGRRYAGCHESADPCGPGHRPNRAHGKITQACGAAWQAAADCQSANLYRFGLFLQLGRFHKVVEFAA